MAAAVTVVVPEAQNEGRRKGGRKGWVDGKGGKAVEKEGVRTIQIAQEQSRVWGEWRGT